MVDETDVLGREWGVGLDPYVREQVRQVLDCTPLTDADRVAVKEGIRRCYEAAGVPWHGTVVWVSSPLIGALAAPIAAAWLREHPAARKRLAAARIRDLIPAAVRLLRFLGLWVPVTGMWVAAVVFIVIGFVETTTQPGARTWACPTTRGRTMAD